MGIAPPSPQQPMSEDPDDFRPASSWRLVVDPDGHVDMSVIYESIGVGDKIPRHWHDVDEVIIIERGDATVHVGGADLDVSDGATVFVPAGTVHGTRNRGEAPVDVRAMFPTTTLRMDLVERNPPLTTYIEWSKCPGRLTGRASDLDRAEETTASDLAKEPA